MVGAVADLIDAGRLKLYCVDSFDGQSWSNSQIPLEERARQHVRYEEWILNDVMQWIYQDCGGTVQAGQFFRGFPPSYRCGARSSLPDSEFFRGWSGCGAAGVPIEPT